MLECRAHEPDHPKPNSGTGTRLVNSSCVEVLRSSISKHSAACRQHAFAGLHSTCAECQNAVKDWFFPFYLSGMTH